MSFICARSLLVRIRLISSQAEFNTFQMRPMNFRMLRFCTPRILACARYSTYPVASPRRHHVNYTMTRSKNTKKKFPARRKIPIDIRVTRTLVPALRSSFRPDLSHSKCVSNNPLTRIWMTTHLHRECRKARQLSRPLS